MNIVVKDIFLNKYLDVKYPQNLHDLHNDLPFLPERTKI